MAQVDRWLGCEQKCVRLLECHRFLLMADTLALELLVAFVVVVVVTKVVACYCSQLPSVVALEVIAIHLTSVVQQLGVAVDVEDAFVHDDAVLAAEASTAAIFGCAVDEELGLTDFALHADVMAFHEDVYDGGGGGDEDAYVNVVGADGKGVVHVVDVAILA